MPAEGIFRRHFYWIVETLLPNTQGTDNIHIDQVPDRAGFAGWASAHQRLSRLQDVLRMEFFSR
jgi:hypothetical protein